MEPMHLVREPQVCQEAFLRGGGSGSERPPQLSRHHDGHAVAHGLCLLHIVRGEDGPPLAALEGGTEGSPAGGDAGGEGRGSGGSGSGSWSQSELMSHHMRCLDLGSIPDDGSSSRMICGFPIMLRAKHSWGGGAAMVVLGGPRPTAVFLNHWAASD